MINKSDKCKNTLKINLFLHINIILNYRELLRFIKSESEKYGVKTFVVVSSNIHD